MQKNKNLMWWGRGGDNEDGRQSFTAEVYNRIVEKSKGANTFNLWQFKISAARVV